MRYLALVVSLVAACAISDTAATLTVGSDPQLYQFTDPAAAVRTSAPGDTIRIAPGTYRIARTVAIEHALTLEATGEVILTGPEDLPEGHVLFQVRTTGPVVFRGIRFRNAGTGIALAVPGEMTIVGCGFRDCEVAVRVVRGKVSVRGSTFQGCWIGVAVRTGGAAELEDSEFSDNGYGVTGDPPCCISGRGNRFVGNGLDLAGDVDPELRSPMRAATEEMVRYPGDGYSSLQEAIDALFPGGTLLLTAPVRESAVVGKDVSIEPVGAGRLTCLGASSRCPGRCGWCRREPERMDTPFLAVVGEAEVRLSRLDVSSLVCGPRATLNLKDVGISLKRLLLTGSARVTWEGGYGGLEIHRDARAEVKGVVLWLGVELYDRALAILRDCDLMSALQISDLARLEAEGITVRGGLIVDDWGRASLSRSRLIGPPAGELRGPQARAVVTVGGFASLELREVEISGGEIGILLPSSGKPRLELDGVTIRGAELGIAVNIRCLELNDIYGLWLPPLSLALEVGSEKIAFVDCGTPVCPLCSLEPWPPDFCVDSGLVEEAPGSPRGLIEALAAKWAEVRSLRARQRLYYSSTSETGAVTVAEIVYLRPDMFRLTVKYGRQVAEIFVCDGKTLWKYYPGSGAVDVVDLSRVRSEFPDTWERIFPVEIRSLGLGVAVGVYPPSAVLQGTEELDGVRTYLFEGLPGRGAGTDVQRARVWVGEDGLWRRVEYLNAEGELTEVKELEVLEVNGEIPQEEFHLELPEGTEVYDETAQALYDLQRSYR